MNPRNPKGMAYEGGESIMPPSHFQSEPGGPWHSWDSRRAEHIIGSLFHSLLFGDSLRFDFEVGWVTEHEYTRRWCSECLKLEMESRAPKA
jgi:hypothetical protein